MSISNARKRIGCVLPALLASLLSVHAGYGQGQMDRGMIEGVVTDRSGVSIADARVEIVLADTNDVIALRTNEMGQFQARNLPIGAYLVVVEKDGFRSSRMANIVLQPRSDSPDEFRSKYLALFRMDPISGK